MIKILLGKVYHNVKPRWYSQISSYNERPVEAKKGIQLLLNSNNNNSNLESDGNQSSLSSHSIEVICINREFK